MKHINHVIIVIAAAFAEVSASGPPRGSDSTSMLQGKVQEMLEMAGEADDETEHIADYKLAADLKCDRDKRAAAAPTEGQVQLASLEDGTFATAHAEEEPAGARAFKTFLIASIVLLFVDGLRRACMKPKNADVSADLSQESPEARINTAKEIVADWVDMINAAKSGDMDGFNTALKNAASVKQADVWGCTPLHYAAVGGSRDIIETLIQEGAEVDARDALEETPLHVAARGGNASACDTLIDAGAAMDAVSAKGMTPLVVAGQQGAKASCRALTQRGAGCGGLADEKVPLLVVSEVIHKALSCTLCKDSSCSFCKA